MLKKPIKCVPGAKTGASTTLPLLPTVQQQVIRPGLRIVKGGFGNLLAPR